MSKGEEKDIRNKMTIKGPSFKIILDYLSTISKIKEERRTKAAKKWLTKNSSKV